MTMAINLTMAEIGRNDPLVNVDDAEIRTWIPSPNQDAWTLKEMKEVEFCFDEYLACMIYAREKWRVRNQWKKWMLTWRKMWRNHLRWAAVNRGK
jgi:hypothetical protein